MDVKWLQGFGAGQAGELAWWQLWKFAEGMPCPNAVLAPQL